MQELTKIKHKILKINKNSNKKIVFENKIILNNFLLPKKLQDDFHDD
jgi:hypothetical protein